MRIGIASTDWSKTVFNASGPVPGGANYVRLQQWRKHSKYESVTGYLIHHWKHGFGIINAKGVPDYDVDLIIAQRIMFKALTEQLRDRKPGGKPILNDLDDWYWGLHRDNAAYEMVQPGNNPEENINHYKDILQLSDGIVVSTPFLRDKMILEFGIPYGNVTMIENCVDALSFKTRNHSQKKPIIGWVGSTAHRSGDLETVKDVFSDSYYRMHHSGASPFAPSMAEKMGISSSRVSVSPMYEPVKYGANAFNFDIGIAPLNDIPFNQAKSWIKAIEYSAAGIPFVASDMPEYRRLHETYGIGRLASSLEEWKHHLAELRDRSVRVSEGKQNQRIVREHLDVRQMAKNYDAVIESYL
jgi:glycosyltransferase involved in cell wall biosynthesis